MTTGRSALFDLSLVGLIGLLAGFLVWMPALAIPIGTLPVQALDILAPLGFILLAGNVGQLSLRASAPMLLVAMSWLGATIAGVESPDVQSMMFLFLGPLPLALAVSFVATTPVGASQFIRGLLFGQIASLMLGFGQFLFGWDVRNNGSFNLIRQSGRVFGAFPEASAYGSAHLCGLAVTLFLLGNGELRPRGVKRVHLQALALISLPGIALSRSSSVFLLTPTVVALILLFSQRRNFSRRIARLGIGLGVTVVGLAYFYSSVFTSRSSGDYINSLEARGATILAAVRPIQEGQFRGAGLGNNHLVEPYVREIANREGLNMSVNDGIASATFARVFEEGYFAFPSIILGFFLLARGLRSHSATARFFSIVGIVWALSATFVSGYRGLYTAWLWYGLAGAVAVRQLAQSRRKNKQGSLTRRSAELS